MTAKARSNAKGRPQHPSKSEEKESAFRDLAAVMESAGYQVRREKLKQGHGWRVVSGRCRIGHERVIFVDRKSSIEDQLFFLLSTAENLSIEVEKNRYLGFLTRRGQP